MWREIYSTAVIEHFEEGIVGSEARLNNFFGVQKVFKQKRANKF